MKHILKFLPIAVCFLFGFTGCKKDNATNFTSYVRGKIDGVAFESNSNIKANTPEPIPPGPSDPLIRITGEWQGYSIKLIINNHNTGNSISTGTYNFETGKNYSALLWQNNVDAYYAGPGGIGDPVLLHGSGTITILEISSNYVRGTFEFTTDVNPRTGISKTVTDGEFYIKRE